MNICVFLPERGRERKTERGRGRQHYNGRIEIPEYALSLTQLREFAKLIYYSIKTRDPTAQG